MEFYGVRNDSQAWFESYLSEREQFVTINGVESKRNKITCGVPQGSVLGPLLFLIFINDLPNATDFLTLLFADDTTFQLSGFDVNILFAMANSELKKASQWFIANELTLNVKKTKFMLFSENKVDLDQEKLNLKIGSQIIEQVGNGCKEKYFKFVGHVLDDKLSWEGHIGHISKKLASANFAINSTKNFLPLKIRKLLYYSLFDSHLNYGNLLWGCAKNTLINKIDVLHKKCIRNVALKKYKAHTEPLFKDLCILKLSDKISYCQALFMHQYRNSKLPNSFTNIFSDISNTDELQTRDNDYNYINKPAIKRNLESFPYKKIIANWNSLDIDLKSTAEYDEFQQLLKEKYLSQYNCDSQCLEPCFSCGS